MSAEPKYQVMPGLTEDEFESLKADIALRGVLVPIEKDEQGNVLDGHHRLRACEELGITDYPVLIRPGMGDEEKRLHALALNLYRRHLDGERRAPLLADLRARGWSYRKIAEVAGVSHEQVRRDTKSIVTNVTMPETIRTSDGRSYPATRPTPARAILTNNPREAEKVSAAIIETPSLLDGFTDSRVLTPENIHKAEKSRDLAEIKESHARLPKVDGGKASLRHMDARVFLEEMPEASADLLLTDPPYSTDVADVKEFAESWLPLALSRVKPTGRAYVCIGAYPDELLAYLSCDRAGFALEQVLVWTYRNTLGPSPAHLYKLNWQAVLYFVGKDAPPLDCPVMVEQFSVQDINAPDGRLGNRYHSWQKPDELAERFIRHSTQPGALVIDPFACTGTFVAAAARLGRIGFGSDIDSINLNLAEARGVEIIR